MAYLIFIARKQPVGFYELAYSVDLGRSYDCGIFVPDIFVSRKHCRFESTMDGWVISDLSSRNGVHFQGQPITRRLLQDGDVFELGTIAIRFNSGSLADQRDDKGQPLESSPAPFGNGAPVIELVDTLFAGGARPAEFIKTNRRRPPKARKRRLGIPAEIAAEPVSPYAEWTELDLEFQIEFKLIHAREALPEPQGEWDGDWTELDIEWQVEAAAAEAAKATPAGTSPAAAPSAALSPASLRAAVAAEVDADEQQERDEDSAANVADHLSNPLSSANRPDEIDLHPVKPSPAGAAAMRPRGGPSPADNWSAASRPGLVETDDAPEDEPQDNRKLRREVIDGVIVERSGRLQGALESIREFEVREFIASLFHHPIRAGIAALVLAVAFGGAVTWKATQPDYKRPRGLTDAQLRQSD